MMFKFLHCADIHLDSPLKGLERYEGAPAGAIRGASRQALKNLVTLCIDEEVAFLLIAGDVYDGDWKDYNTGLFFAKEMSRLRQAEIPVFVVSGNHDAGSQITRQLPLPENVRVFPTEGPATELLENLGIAIHGQGFARREIREDLSASYPQARRGLFNIGLLHTSADGREGHESYAPTSIDRLLSRGYDYWALGHIHTREVLHEAPWVLFPGNLQGRHIRETGPKGCTLVSVEDGEVRSVDHKTIDVLRWSLCSVDATGAEDFDRVQDLVEEHLRDELEQCPEKPLAIRFRIEGACGAHARITSTPGNWTQQIRALATDLSAGRAWVEKVEWKTSPPAEAQELAASDDALGGLLRSLAETEESDAALGELASELAGLRRRLPPELFGGDEQLDLESVVALRRFVREARDLLLPRLLGSDDTLS